MPLKDLIHLVSSPSRPSKEPLLLFLITGNPGLIEYYRTFLSLCLDKLQKSYGNTHSITVTGVSMRGFNVEEPTSQGPFELQQQISYIDQSLQKAIESQGKQVRVILAGHSVGSYILLEVLRRRKERLSAGGAEPGRVIGGICLFPTVTHIAKSDSGRKFSIFFEIPYFAFIAGLVVRALFVWVPSIFLQRLVGMITGFPASAAQVTTAFLKSPGGVRQALHLANHEMRTITDDAWSEELWGATTTSPLKEKTKLYFYFGTNDHWVADETRDELIAARAATGKGGEEDKPRMEIDESGTPHGFCIQHNEIVAKKVEEYIKEIVERNW